MGEVGCVGPASSPQTSLGVPIRGAVAVDRVFCSWLSRVGVPHKQGSPHESLFVMDCSRCAESFSNGQRGV